MTSLDLTRNVYGRLTVLDEAEPVSGHRMWRCACECGEEITTRQGRLRSGETQSCGCLARGLSAERQWVGEQITYYGMHLRLSREHGVASSHPCIDCGEQAAGWSYIRGCPEERLPIDDYARERGVRSPFCHHPSHYAPRCGSCHGQMDWGPLQSARRARTALLAGIAG